MPKKIAILGLGWLGLPLANSFLEQGYEVTGSTTSSEKLMRLLQSQLSVKIIKVTHNTIEGNWKSFIRDCDVLLINIPPSRDGNSHTYYPQQIAQIAKRCDPNLNIIFVSSTSVYADNNQIATEKDELNPTKESGKALVEAEKIIQARFGEHATILRFAGLYGPNRHPGRFLKRGSPIPNPEASVNLIHLNDCINLISKVISQNCFGEIMNGCADNHPTKKVFYSNAAFNLSLDQPLFETGKPSTGKTVCNLKSKTRLDLTYQNPEDFLDTN